MRSFHLMLRAFFVAAVLLASCGGQTASAPSPSPVEDCRGGPEAAGGSVAPNAPISYPNLTVDNRLRDYRLFRPASLDTSRPVALVIVMPPPTADADALENIIHFDAEASTAGFVTASPNGCESNFPYIQGGSKVADEDFVRKMILTLESQFQVSKVGVVSVSGSSRIAYRLACDMADRISAVADVAGTMVLKDPCSPARPVSILEIHGTNDADSPWAGGGPHTSYPVEAVNALWRQLDGCSGDLAITQSGITISSSWTNCTGGVTVRLDKVVGGNHEWFGSGGPDSVPGEPDANSLIGRFLTGR